MSTIQFVSDSISAHLSKAVESCSNCIHAANTNLADVRVARIVCYSIVMITLIIGVIILIGQILKTYSSLRREKCGFERDEMRQTNELYRSLLKKCYEQYICDTASLKYKSPSQKAEDLLKEIEWLTQGKEGFSMKEYVDGLSKLNTKITKLISNTESKRIEKEDQIKKNEQTKKKPKNDGSK